MQKHLDSTRREGLGGLGGSSSRGLSSGQMKREGQRDEHPSGRRRKLSNSQSICIERFAFE